jgi:prepilin-type N-terminal cleavage/methylation domain-containing protein
MNERQRGQSLMELMVATAVIGVMLTAVTTSLDQARNRIALAAATAEMRAILQRVRMIAVARDRNVGVKFQEEGGVWTYAVHEDGDGDGVRNDDILRGTDRRIEPRRTFQHAPARIGVPAGRVPDPLSGGLLSSRTAVRFSSSTLCSFSKRGEASNGSLVLTDGKRATIVQVRGGSAVIAVWRWNGEYWRRGE